MVTEEIAERYRRFAAVETEGISALYTELSRAVAEHRPTLEFLATLPRIKQQPNLLLAAARSVFGTPTGPDDFLSGVHEHLDRVRTVMLTRSNQMNEPARCGVQLPLLAGIDGPISLIEVGASAGLCLLPDLYRYRYRLSDGREYRVGTGGPEIVVSVEGSVPLPTRMPEIVWRAGLDLNPVDLSRPGERDWLLNLIWPEQTHRARRLRAAMAVAAEHRPPVIEGDLRTDLPALVAQAPPATTVVVVNTAVLVYLPSRDDIDGFAATIDALGVRWICSEAPTVFPEINAEWTPVLGRDFSLMVDGIAVGAAGPHGQSLRWFSRR